MLNPYLLRHERPLSCVLQKQLRLDQNLICDRLFVGGGEEKQWESELTEAMMDGVTKLDGGFPDLFYNHIPVLFFYAAACKTVRRAIVRVKDGTVCSDLHLKSLQSALNWLLP